MSVFSNALFCCVMIIKRIATVLMLLLPATLLAQTISIKEKGIVLGMITDAKGNAIDGATVKIFLLNESKAIQTTFSDKSGNFQFNNLPLNFCKITIQVLNASQKIIDSIALNKDRQEIDLGQITVSQQANNLSEVIVYSARPLVENKDDKIVFNMSESPLSNGSSTAEMMKNMPLMSVDPDGTIKLAGKVPLILMDEKPVNANGQQLQDLLESLPANVVEKVEIMQNPPPEYATYDGGVINIVTKKGKIGTYKKISGSYGTKGEESLNGSYSYKNAKLGITGYAGYTISNTIGNSYTKRKNYYTNSVNYFYTNSGSATNNRRPSMRIQTDYDFSKRSMLSVVYQGGLSFFHTKSNTLYQNLDSNLNTYKASTRKNEYDGSGYWQGFSASYTWKGINPVEKLQMVFSFNASKNDNERDFYQQFLLNNFIPSGNDSTQNQYFDNFSRTLYFKGDYNRPLNDTASLILTTGITYTQNRYHNILNTSYLNKTDSSFIVNNLLSNDFYFTQSIFTARAGLIVLLPLNFKIIGGVQAENTATDFEFIKGIAHNAGNCYWTLLPNISLRKQFSKKMNAGLYFRQTIRRPGIVELNPSIDYSDPYNIRFGNPLIQPAITNNYDANISYNLPKFNIGLSAGYSKIKDVFNSIRTLTDSGKTITTYQNISDQEEFHASVWSGITVKKLRFNISGGWNYNKYSDREKQLYKFVDGGGFYSGCNISFTPDNLTNLEANTRYSNYASPQGSARSNISMSLGVQRKFLNKQLIVAFNAIDPFGLLHYHGYTYAPNFTIESYSSVNSQNFRLTVSYQISKIKLRSNLNDKDKKQALEKLSNKAT